MSMKLTPVVQLGVAEAYAIAQRLGLVALPPLDAIGNEDWGRDWLLSHFEDLSPATLAGLGLTRDAAWNRNITDSRATSEISNRRS